jgi:hypothetical protein
LVGEPLEPPALADAQDAFESSVVLGHGYRLAAGHRGSMSTSQRVPWSRAPRRT